MGVRGLPSVLTDAQVLKTDVTSFAGTTVHIDLMGTYFAYIHALYFQHLRKEAARIASQSTIAGSIDHYMERARHYIRALCCGIQTNPSQLRFIADALHKKFQLSGFDQTLTTIHVDGQRPNEKRREHAARDTKENTALRHLNANFIQPNPQAQQLPQQQPQQQQPQQQQHQQLQPPRLRKFSIAAIEKKAKSIVHVPRAALTTICQLLTNLGWNIHNCAFESDLCIAQSCQTALLDWALSNDSDLFVYPSVQNLVRPVWGQRNKFQLFVKQTVLRHLQLDNLQMLLIGIVTHNDYNEQFDNYGIGTNMEIAKQLGLQGLIPANVPVIGPLSQATVTAAVNAYIQHVTGINPAAAGPAAAPGPAAVLPNFTDAITVFAGMTQTPVSPPVLPPAAVAVPTVLEQVTQRLVDLELIKISRRREPRAHAHAQVHQGPWRRLPNAAPPPAPPAPVQSAWQRLHLPTAAPAAAPLVTLAKSGVHRPHYHRRIIIDYTQGGKMPANYLQTKAGRKIKPGGPAAPKGKARAASARSTHSGSRRGSVRSTRSSQASHVPVRNLRAITTYKHQLEKVFQTSSLPVGSWKAKLRDDMLVICDNLSSLLAGSSQMMTGKRPHGPRPGRHAKVRITDEGVSVVSASSSRSASPAPSVAAGVGPAAAGVGAAAAGVGPAASMHSVAAGGVGSSASSIAAGADPRKVIAWDMYNYLVQELQHRPVIGAKEYMPEATSRRELSRAVRDLAREHFTQLFPILNDKARLVDTFMVFSETSFLDLLWPQAKDRAAREVRQTAEKLCTCAHATTLSQNTGDLIEMLFFGQQGSQHKAQVSSYDQKRTSMSSLMTGTWTGAIANTPNPFDLASLKTYSTAAVGFRQRRSVARQNNTPFTEVAPALPTSVTLRDYYVPIGVVRTNGLEFQVLAYDLRKPCPPPQKFHMPETTKIIKDIAEEFPTPVEITNAFGANYANVPVVGIDPGEVVSAAGCGINVDLRPVGTNTVTVLTIKRAALYAPIFRDRYLMEKLKEEPPPVPRANRFPSLAAAVRPDESVNDIQNGMVDFGDGSPQAVRDHLRAWETAFRKLREFYSCNAYKKRNWARRKAVRAEYDWAVTGLLSLALLDTELNQLHRRVTDVGVKKALFVYGSARYNTHTKLSSLRTSLMGHFYRKATALGHVVVVADEYRTSSICPNCDQWLAKPTMRSCFCVSPQCNRYIHRDIVGGHNIARIGRQWLLQLSRPPALSPIYEGIMVYVRVIFGVILLATAVL
ncbi:unnamed protein product [Mortierella alpina]